MATYLCVKVNNTTKKFTAKESKEAGKPYLRVPGGYFPLTTETTTGTQLKVRANNTNYRIVETYMTTINTTTNTTTTVQAQSSSSVTSSDSLIPFYERATNEGFIPYVATYTRGNWYSGLGTASISISGRSSNSDKTSTRIFNNISTRIMNNQYSTSLQGIIYYNSSLSVYRIQASKTNFMILNTKNNEAVVYNTKLDRTTFSYDVPTSIIVYVGALQNIVQSSATIVGYTLYNQNNIVFSTENYTYETTSNTIANTTIETTSQ